MQYQYDPLRRVWIIQHGALLLEKALYDPEWGAAPALIKWAHEDNERAEAGERMLDEWTWALVRTGDD